MTIDPTPSPQPVQTSFVPLAATAAISSTAGNEIGQSLADVLNWVVSLSCHCTPPVFVLHFFQDACSLLTVGVAMSIHYLVVKQKGN